MDYAHEGSVEPESASISFAPLHGRLAAVFSGAATRLNYLGLRGRHQVRPDLITGILDVPKEFKR